MAVTSVHKMYRMTAAADKLDDATIGIDVVRVNAIYIKMLATGGQTIITVDPGAVQIINEPGAANTTVPYLFSKPQDIRGLAVPTIGANTEVLVFFE